MEKDRTMCKTKLMKGDCLDRLKDLEDDSLEACVTDPPYGLKFMSKKWDHDVPTVELWREVYRVLKPGAHLLAFFGTRTYHRGACAIEDAGFEIRDQIGWLYGSGFPKSLDIGKAIDKMDGWGTALKPAWEPIVVARKPFKGTVAQNVLEHGTGGINVDGCRVPGPKGVPASLSEAGQHGWGTGGDMDRKSIQNGRFPANIIHDGSDEVLAAFPNDSQRFFYCAKASKKERNAGLERMPELSAGEATDRKDGSAGLNSPRAGAGRTGGSKNSHPTVKPIALMEYLIKLVTPPGGTVLDPFAGSGSTLIAAKRLGVNSIGIELEAEYVEIIKARMSVFNEEG
jgi:site-specific DNA-methyltransferase (adenine-specific)